MTIEFSEEEQRILRQLQTPRAVKILERELSWHAMLAERYEARPTALQPPQDIERAFAAVRSDVERLTGKSAQVDLVKGPLYIGQYPRDVTSHLLWSTGMFAGTYTMGSRAVHVLRQPMTRRDALANVVRVPLLAITVAWMSMLGLVHAGYAVQNYVQSKSNHYDIRYKKIVYGDEHWKQDRAPLAHEYAHAIAQVAELSETMDEAYAIGIERAIAKQDLKQGISDTALVHSALRADLLQQLYEHCCEKTRTRPRIHRRISRDDILTDDVPLIDTWTEARKHTLGHAYLLLKHAEYGDRLFCDALSEPKLLA